MIKCHLSRLLGERKLKISDVSRDTGVNRGTLTRLYQETAERVDLSVMAVLCDYLECEVGDLFENISKDNQ
jgi:putative transcriptional regulator